MISDTDHMGNLVDEDGFSVGGNSIVVFRSELEDGSSAWIAVVDTNNDGQPHASGDTKGEAVYSLIQKMSEDIGLHFVEVKDENKKVILLSRATSPPDTRRYFGSERYDDVVLVQEHKATEVSLGEAYQLKQKHPNHDFKFYDSE